MYPGAILVLFVSLFAFSAAGPSGRIVGGTPVKQGDFPYAVSIQLDGAHHCGGFIYNEQWVLTTASCVTLNSAAIESRRLTVLAADVDLLDGLEEGQESYPVNIVAYDPDYSFSSGGNDTALLRTTRVFNFTNPAINCVKIGDVEPTGSATGTIIGYGATSSGGLASSKLRKGSVTMNGDCTVWGREYDVRYMICAGLAADTEKPCDLDQGSPLIQDGIAVGMLSKQISCQATPYASSIYTRVVSNFVWIKQEASEQPATCLKGP